jgi:hypothetical protein
LEGKVNREFAVLNASLAAAIDDLERTAFAIYRAASRGRTDLERRLLAGGRRYSSCRQD